MDGIPITDMAALGSSPTYYDFDMFQEMQVTTGGADVTTVTPGVGMNFVLRSGTNRWRGSARYYFENDGMQSDNVSTALIGQIASYNRMQQVHGYGLRSSAARSSRTSCGSGARTARRIRAIRIYTFSRPAATAIFNQGTDSKCSTQLARRASRRRSRTTSPHGLHDPQELLAQGERGHQRRDARVVHVLPRATRRSSDAARARRIRPRPPGTRRARRRCTRSRSTGRCPTTCS